MGIRIFLKYIILLITLIFNLVYAGTGCTFNSSSNQWDGCVKEYYLFNTKCNKGTDCSEGNSGKYLFKCSSANSCSEITEAGYYLNQNKNDQSNELFKCKNEGNCSLITESPVDSNETTFYLDGSSKNTENKFNKLIKCDGNNVNHQSRGSNGDSSNTEFSCKIINNESSNTSVDHYISMEEEKDRVITCTEQGCYVEENISGYFINTNSGNSEGKIIVCEKDKYCDIVEDDNICFGAGDVIVKPEKDGSKKGYLCTSDSEDEKDIIEIQSNAENVKYISITVNNPNDDEDDEDNFFDVSDGSKICIKIGEGSVVSVDEKYCPKECDVTTGTNCIENSYYLVHEKTLNTITSGSGLLYYCKAENDCTQITETGYYIVDKDTIYFCSSTTCKNDITVEKCDDNGIGRIVFKNNDPNSKLSICLNGKISVDILKSNNGNYMVKGSGNTKKDTLFASEGKFAIISIKDQVITLNSKYNNNMKYVYVNNSSSGNQKVMEKGDTCPMEDNKITNVLEFECNNGICTTNAI